MSTPDQPMTRRQMRELAKTGALPVQGADDTTPEPESVDAGDAERDVTPEHVATEEVVAAEVVAEEVAADEIAAEEVAADDIAAEEDVVLDVVDTSGDSSLEGAHDAPAESDAVDLDAAPLTRRQARDQERIRTASVPLISSEDADAHAAQVAAEEQAQVVETDVVDDESPVEGGSDAVDAQLDDRGAVAPEAAEAEAEAVEVEVEVEAEAVEADAGSADDTVLDEQVGAAEEAAEPVVVGPQFGASLLAGEPEVEAIELPASFDELIARNASSASIATPSALILSQAPEAPSLSGPITATGEIILTGSYRLPDGLGSAGADPRSTDDKHTDAVLIDGELPPASSPTPIAASAAVSTIRGADEVIRPPAPEKGNRLVLALAITAGVLMIAVIGVLVAVVASGALS